MTASAPPRFRLELPKLDLAVRITDARPHVTRPRSRDHAIAFRYLDTPIGRILLASSHDRLIKVEFANSDHDEVLHDISATLDTNARELPAKLDAAAHQLDEYFAGTRHSFELPLDLHLLRGDFRRRVVTYLPHIAYGTTQSYGEVAAALDASRAARAVGTGCAHNPLPLVLPCHRVVRADGEIGNFGGGTEVKRWLLDHEIRHANVAGAIASSARN